MADITIGLHGGAGALPRDQLSEAEWAQARADMKAALLAGWKILRAGGTALDAVEACVIVLEDSPHFNAGHGAALNADGEHELDAAIMDGATFRAGALAGVRRIRNPISAARRLLEQDDTVLLGGAAGDAFAAGEGLAMVDPAYFTTERRVKALASLKARALAGTVAQASEGEKHGTVGAVARDSRGNLAAATSTGGFNNKPVGRIGDSPIIGAGTYAENGIAAVSGTGRGEVFIRCVAAHEVAARIRLGGAEIGKAAHGVIHDVLSPHGIGAGMIALGAAGDPVAPYNTLGMHRGWITTAGAIFAGSHEDMVAMGLAP